MSQTGKTNCLRLHKLSIGEIHGFTKCPEEPMSWHLTTRKLTFLFVTIAFCIARTPALAQSRQASGASDPLVMHVLNRLTYGPRSGDLERVKRIGIARFIDEQLNPSSLPLAPEVYNRTKLFQ